MKTYRTITAALLLAVSLSSCESLLDVSNPNYFTDDQMAEFMAGSAEAEQQVLTGLVGTLLIGAALTGVIILLNVLTVRRRVRASFYK